ncbi:MAG: nickel pincer cofactor biosynthesis protein LarC [Terrisporobacter sp.]|uniref:nickel pincer cofactor biosynthesis protein LarC n=1 Tax=Terrisporobacter sp. TaxID=1965305 RepID=UPI003996BD90
MKKNILYFDIIGGISGDMTLASLLDLGVPKEIFLQELNKLNMDNEFEIEIDYKYENGIKGTKVNVITKEQYCHRNLIDVYDIIDNSRLNNNIKERAKEIFMIVAKAEAKVHGTTIDKIHFHEVGAIDSIVDIVGSCILLDLLNIDKVYSTSVPLGSGFIQCAHGVIPAAAPATVEILKNIPVKFNHVKGECTTPTGAAIIKTICDEFIDELDFNTKKIGYGVGHKKFEKPNILRVALAQEDEHNEVVYEIVANIDDMSSEIYSYLFEKIMDEGALDVFTESIFMKKNRPAYKISILTKKKDLNKFIKLLLTETSTFGVRYKEYNRAKLDRKFIEADTIYGKVKVKLGYYNNKLIKLKPEYEQCKLISKTLNIELREVYNEINKSINEKININLLT